MAGLDGAAANARLDGSVLGAAARRQYAALARMRWQMFGNGLRTNQGVFEFGARTFTYLVYGMIGLGMCAGLGAGSYAMLSSHSAKYLPILYWAVFLIWQLLPILLASFQEQFDLSILLRFPLSFRSYVLLYLIFGLVDISSITGALCCLGLWAGTVIARPGLFAWAALGLAVFAAFNILLVRAIFAWIDRWLAQRRTREIVGGIFLICVLSLQLLNPALREGRHQGHITRDQRIANQRKMAEQFYPWLRRADEVQRWLPPGLAADTEQMATVDQPAQALESLGVLALFAVLAGGILAARLKKEYAGESLGESPARAKSPTRGAQARTAGARLGGGSGPINAIIEKDLRAMLRTMPLLYAIGAPLILVLVFSGVFVRMGPIGQPFPFALPICLIYAQLGFIQIFYNSLGTEGVGIQLYFLSPTPIRTVMLAKNLLHTVLFLLVAATAALLTVLRIGPPPQQVAAASAAWILFVIPCNLTAGNIFSLVMPYRVNPGRLSRQRGSQANSLLAMLVEALLIGVGALVFWLCWWFDEKWLATPIFLVLAVIATVVWLRTLRNTDALASRRKDHLLLTLAKTG